MVALPLKIVCQHVTLQSLAITEKVCFICAMGYNIHTMTE